MKAAHKSKSASKQKTEQSFLNKFKDKHSVISKEGLLKLFQSKRKSIENKILELKQNNPQPNHKIKLKALENDKYTQISKSHSQTKSSQDSAVRSVQLPEISRKLPAIHKSISTTLKLSNKNRLDLHAPLQVQTDSLAEIRKNQISHTKIPKSPRYLFQMDKFTVEHLNFLQKFEQRLQKRQLKAF